VSLVYWGIVTGVIAMVTVLFFCIAVMPAAPSEATRRDDRAIARDDEAADVRTESPRHAA
jgi:hypothetical protein